MTLLFTFALLVRANGPVLDLPADPVRATQRDESAFGIAPLDDRALLRGLQDARLHAGGTVIGGYGQIDATALSVGPGNDGAAIGKPALSASVRRLVLFVAHTFEFGPRVYTELEWENALACRTCVGSAEVEQAFVEWPLLSSSAGDAVALRGGLMLVPVGIINQWHEPPVFHGVQRPRLEEGGVIPSTWRELGVGVTGTPLPGLRYELYATTGLDPAKLQSGGLVAARSNGGLAPAQSLMVSSRVELEPVLGFLCGVSALAGDMGGWGLAATPFFDVNGDALPLRLPLYGVDADARVRRAGVEARVLVVAMFMPAAGDLMQARRADGTLLFRVDDGATGALPTRMLGASLEVAYDVLRVLSLVSVETEQQLLPFVRVEYSDGQSAVPDGFERDGFFDVKELTVGASYRPIRQIVVKADAQLRNRRLGFDETQVNVGLGFMF